MAAADPADWRIAWYYGLCALADGQPATGAGRRSAPSTTTCPASSPPSSRSASPPRRPATWPPHGATTSSSGRSTGPTSAPRSARPGPAWRPATGPAAIAAVAAVPQTSSHHAAAQIAAVRLLVAAGDKTSGSDVHEAGERLVKLPLDDLRREQLTLEILHAALSLVSGPAAGGTPQSGAPAGYARILGCEPNERALRFGLERGYRALASLTPDPARRVELVDMANQRQAEDLDMTYRCPSCGQPFDAADGFCEACGSPLVPAAVSPGARPACPSARSAPPTARPRRPGSARKATASPAGARCRPSGTTWSSTSGWRQA